VTLKAVIFNVSGVLLKDSNAADQTTAMAAARKDAIRIELRLLFDFLRSRSVRPVIVTNHNWTFTDRQTGVVQPIEEGLTQLFGAHTLYVASRGDMPFKPLKDALDHVLAHENLQVEEAIVVGKSKEDFRAAINSGLLFLNATWDKQEVPYGFAFDTPLNVQRFIDLFALKEHPWFYRIDDPVRYMSLAPFSTMKEAYAEYSGAARNAAKRGSPERHFFLNTLVASLYFSGISKDIDYIAAVPGHAQGYGNRHMDDVLTLAGEVFRARYLPDLVVRHTTAASNRATRVSGEAPLPETQLNTIHLTSLPLFKAPKRYKNAVKLKGKTVLVFDDFTTRGYSFEAVRAYLAASGANAILVSWLKTINSDYTVLTMRESIRPFEPNTGFTSASYTCQSLPYHQHIVDTGAVPELLEAFRRFREYSRT